MILGRKQLKKLTIGALPFADAASEGLPLGQLLRLSLFQVSVGMCSVLLLGTLNRVMIVELAVPATVVALMIALPVLSAPFRALMGHRSDNHRSALGWKRIPYLWFGSLWQMGAGHHALRADRAVGRPDPRPRLGRRGSGGAGLPDGGPRHAHDPDGGPRPRLGPRHGRDAAAGGGAALCHVPRGHGDLVADRGLAPVGLLRAAADPRRAGLRLHDHGPEHRRALETGTCAADVEGGARSPPAAPPRRLGRTQCRRHRLPAPDGGGLRHARLQHAGRAARALRRRDHRPAGVGHDAP